MLLAGAIAAFLVWWSFRSALRANPARLARLLKRGGGVVAIAAAILLMLRGRLDMAVLLAGAGISLLYRGELRMPQIVRALGAGSFGGMFAGRARATGAGRTTRVRSAMIEAELDHDSGQMRGTVLAGLYAGRALDELNGRDLRRLSDECRGADVDGFRLLQAYLDRRFAGRREHAERDHDAGPGTQPERGAMTQQEAYEVLGLEAGAPEHTIRQAHRQLMKKLHPDQGGSTYLASRVNQAKDVLLNRHR